VNVSVGTSREEEDRDGFADDLEIEEEGLFVDV
jgi:hypothetical protein